MALTKSSSDKKPVSPELNNQATTDAPKAEARSPHRLPTTPKPCLLYTSPSPRD